MHSNLTGAVCLCTLLSGVGINSKSELLLLVWNVT